MLRFVLLADSLTMAFVSTSSSTVLPTLVVGPICVSRVEDATKITGRENSGFQWCHMLYSDPHTELFSCETVDYVTKELAGKRMPSEATPVCTRVLKRDGCFHMLHIPQTVKRLSSHNWVKDGLGRWISGSNKSSGFSLTTANNKNIFPSILRRTVDVKVRALCMRCFADMIYLRLEKSGVFQNEIILHCQMCSKALKCA